MASGNPLVDALFDASQSGIDPASEFVLGDLSDVEEFEAEWLWEGHIYRGHLNLLDARHESGKSRFILQMACCLSLGSFPFTGFGGGPVSFTPARSLIFAGEDYPGETKTTVRELGGNMRMIKVWDPTPKAKGGDGPLVLNEEGLERLTKLIQVNQFDYVAFDPIIDFLPDTINPNQNNQVSQFLARLRVVAVETNCAIKMVRHFTKDAMGRGITEMGSGAAAWVTKSRRHHVMLRHPNCIPNVFFQSLVVPVRGSQRSSRGQYFAIEIRDGRQTFVPHAEVPVEVYTSQYQALAAELGKAPNLANGSRGPMPAALQKCADDITDFLRSNGWKVHYRDFSKHMESLGHAARTISRAKARLTDEGVLAYENGYLQLTNAADPFVDEKDSGSASYWADLDD